MCSALARAALFCLGKDGARTRPFGIDDRADWNFCISGTMTARQLCGRAVFQKIRCLDF
jgi:hypothetical protein